MGGSNKPEPVSKRPLSEEELATTWDKMTPPVRRYFLDELRNARQAVQADAEAFASLLFVFERLGCFLIGEASALGGYRGAFKEVFERSALNELNRLQLAWHSAPAVLFKLVQDARNDALHQGARARHLAELCIEFALILEDALMSSDKSIVTVGDLMIRSPITVEPWQPVSFARQLMLTHSFSYLPILHEGVWCLLGDAALAIYLRTGTDRKKQLGTAIKDAIGPRLELPEAKCVAHSAPIAEILGLLSDQPLLVLEDPPTKDAPQARRLIGLITAFDVL